jgi:DNA replication protein DnaC
MNLCNSNSSALACAARPMPSHACPTMIRSSTASPSCSKPSACIATASPRVDGSSWPSSARARWQQIISLNWFKQHQHLLLVGPTGIGKSYLACALAKAVVDQKKSVRYLRLPRLGEELTLLQAQGRLSHWLKTMSRIDLIILDDFGLIPMSANQQPLLLELLEDRQQRGSVLVTSQLPVKLWHGQFHDPTLADAILDRLVHNAELIELTGESMRKRSTRSATHEDKSNPTT